MRKLIITLLIACFWLLTFQAGPIKAQEQPKGHLISNSILKWSYYSAWWLGLACDAFQDGYTWKQIHGGAGEPWLIHRKNWHGFKTVKNLSYIAGAGIGTYSLFSGRVSKRTMLFRSLSAGLIGWTAWDFVYWRTRYGTWNRYEDRQETTVFFFKFKSEFPYIDELRFTTGPVQRLAWDGARVALGFYLLGKDEPDREFKPNAVDKYFLKQVERLSKEAYEKIWDLILQRLKEAETEGEDTENTEELRWEKLSRMMRR